MNIVLRQLFLRIGLALAALAVAGCAILPNGAYTNQSIADPAQPPSGGQASFVLRPQREAKACIDKPVADPKRQKDALVLLSLSGGGSRAAYFSALAMLEMQRLKIDAGGGASDLLHEVDAISSVSGGSLAAAYYAVSADPGTECAAPSGRLWDAANDGEIRSLMTNRYRIRWIGNWFWPDNIFLFWFSNYDRTDIMAQTLADNLFDRTWSGIDLRLRELNPLRPNLILNATAGSRSPDGRIAFGDVFTFTAEDFKRICSSIDDYKVSRAVMATASFPGVFNFMTLRDHCPDPVHARKGAKAYLHVFDGGNADNLGLTSLKRVVWAALEGRDKEPVLPQRAVLVIQVDAFTGSQGANPLEADPRGFLDYLIDTNAIDATDSLLEANREKLLDDFRGNQLFPFAAGQDGTMDDRCRRFFRGGEIAYCERKGDYWGPLNRQIRKKLRFEHLGFHLVGAVEGCGTDDGQATPPDCLRRQLNAIATDFQFKGERHPETGLTDPEALACAVPLMFGRADPQRCGKLRVKADPALAQRWEAVRAFVQAPAPSGR